MPVEATGFAKVTLLPLVSIAPLLAAVSVNRLEMSVVTAEPYCSVPLETRIVPLPRAPGDEKFKTPC